MGTGELECGDCLGDRRSSFFSDEADPFLACDLVTLKECYASLEPFLPPLSPLDIQLEPTAQALEAKYRI